jgi:hypothetical protein
MEATPQVPQEQPYPLIGEVERQEEYNRFLPLVKWLLLIPHYIVLAVLGIAAFIVVVIAFFAVLFTRRYPRGMFDFVVGVYRWTWRVFAYLLLMTDRYPPFTLADDPEFPARFEITYPEEVDRWRPLVQWLLILPYGLIARILQYLAGIIAFFAVFTILFTRRYPEGMFRIVLVTMRWNARASAYAGFMTTRYPPFVWD